MGNKIEQSIRMRDGSVASDPRLGRLEEFDERSRDYSVRELLSAEPPLRGRKWYSPRHYILNQGIDLGFDNWNPSGCTGFSRTYDLAGSPVPVKILSSDPSMEAKYVPPDNYFAFALYKLAQQFDEWAGEAYEGSSVLGAFKAAQALGYIGEYRWAFDIDDFIDALGHIGPVVVGSAWLNSMFDPKPSGLVDVDFSSGEAGGHAFDFDHLIVSRRAMREHLGAGEPIREGDILLGGPQSWGEGWGHNGRYLFWASDMEALLKDNGEAAVSTVALHQ